MTLNDLNKLSKPEVEKHLSACCGSAQWLSELMLEFPFSNEKDLIQKAENAWYDRCSETDWLESFTHHPKIGDVKSLTEKFAGKEQASVGAASKQIIGALANANLEYEHKFGFIFIVCATGKSANEMLRLMNDRLKNTKDEELNIAMGEQHKITFIRFKKMLDEANWNDIKVSQLTTHVLDTSVGKPGKDITIRLKHFVNGSWRIMAQGVTNADGRIGDLLPPGRIIAAGNYRMVFETGDYFQTNNIKGFYPSVDIEFSVFDDAHYHVPLLINPFGYSTYRGS